MNIMRIVVKEFKHNSRNWKANSMMILFPIVLILILGAAFSGQFNRDISLDNIKVQYMIKSSPHLAESFKAFTEAMTEELDIEFIEIDEEAEGMNSIKHAEYSCFVLLDNDPDEIKIYKNARYNFEANLVESMLKTFTGRYDAIAQISKSNPAVLEEIMADTAMNFVATQSLDKKKQPGSLDYYAVTMLTLILMYASETGFWGIKSEQNFKTGNRILASPVRKHELLVGKVLGGVVVTILQAAIVLLFGKYILKANWGSDLATVFLIVITESIMAISLGTGVAFLIKNEGTAIGILNTLLPVLIFLGGGYVPLSQFGGALQTITNISPLKWTNDAIFRIIYNADYSIAPIALLINLGAAAAILIAAALYARKEVF